MRNSSAIWPVLKQTYIYSEGKSNYLHFKRHLLCSGQFNCLHLSTIIQYCLSYEELPQFCLAMLSALIDPREKSHFRRKKKTNQTESRQWSSTVQAHIKKAFMLREKVQRDEPLITVISKGKHAKTQAEQVNPSAFQLIPDTVSSMPCSHRQHNSTICLSVWAKPKAFRSAAAQWG